MKVHSVNPLSRDGRWLDHEWEGPDDLSSETSSNESIRDMEVISSEKPTFTKLPPIHSTISSTIKSSSLTDSISNIIQLTLPFISFRPPHLSDKDLSQLYLSVYSSYKANPPPMGLVLRYLHDEVANTSKLEVLDMEFVTLERLNITMISLFELVIQKSISLLIIKGGDDRLHLNKQGVNKYLCSPVALPTDAIHRAYCTCSPPSSLGIASASRLLKRIWLGEISTEKAGEEIRRNIRMHLHLSPEVEVVLHPSGTDAEITPLLAGIQMSKRLECDHVFNILTASTEVGSQSSIAAAGKHISSITPSGNTCNKNALLNGFPATTVIEIPHRNPDGTLMSDYDEEVLKLILSKNEEHPNSFFIVHLVGSKTGLCRPSKSIVSKLKEKLGSNLLLVYDACQMRCDISEFKWYVAQGAFILITGSKFYGGPSFCGAVLCPMYISHILKTTRPIIKDALCDYLSPSDACRKLWDFLGIKPNTESNIGLLMRWECALAEMRSFSNVFKKVSPLIGEWVRSAHDLINSHSPHLKAYAEETNREEYLGGSNTVVSIVCYDEMGSPLDIDAMKKIHIFMTQDMSSKLPLQSTEIERDVASITCYIGQPVSIGKFNVVRLALGAPVARQMAEPLGLKRVLIEDSLILKKLSVLTRYYSLINEHA